MSSQPTTPQTQLPKTYNPAETEPRIRARWDGAVVDGVAGAFHADPARVLSGEREGYAIVIPPPNVTAALHLGHALNNTIQDILARAHRMMGYETLWMPGTDHAGIATQAVVERRVFAEEGKRRTDFSREEFIAKIQLFKDEYEATITDQLKLMGCSCDWSRQRFTMDEQCAAAVREAFFRLFRDGLIYRGKRLVNWDPVLQTAVADDECEDIEVDAHFYYLRYPLVHPKAAGVAALQPVTWSELATRGYPHARQHPAEEPAWVTVATTRPETYLGDTAVAVNPLDPRAVPLRGLMVELPLVGRVIPIVEDDYVVLPARDSKFYPGAAPGGEPEAVAEGGVDDAKAAFATGFLKVTPAHDANDYELGRRHDLAMINVMAPDASISDKHGWTDIGDAHIFVGKSREEARKLVLDEFYARGLLEETRPYRHSVKHSDRTKAAIEPYLSDQWYVKVTDERMARAANEALVGGQRTGELSGGAGLRPARADTVGPTLHTTERRLPHWQLGGSTYFITFRVQDGTMTETERRIVLDACRHWHGERFEMHAAVVMADHVHLLLSPFSKGPGEWHSLSDLLRGIKTFSARAINQARGESGAFWQAESFDRIVRDGDELREKLVYMENNPVKAGLAARGMEYPFLWVSEQTRAGRLEFAEKIGGEQGEGAMGGGGGRPEACPTSLRFYPARYAKTYEQWHENIRDWCISRQLWWGHRIPVFAYKVPNFIMAGSGVGVSGASAWKRLLDAAGIGDDVQLAGDPDEGSSYVYVCTRSVRAHELIREVMRMNSAVTAENYTPAASAGNVGQFAVSSTFASLCVELTGLGAHIERASMSEDPDVLDTWFSSALWPLSTMGWPEPARFPGNEGMLEAFNPTSVLCTAREIITLWVSRMVMFNQYFGGGEGRSDGATKGGSARGPVPFRDVFIHAMIQDGEGRKMSKSLGNGVDPRDIIASHGADAMRFTLCHMTTQTQDVRMPVVKDPATGTNTSPKFDLGRNFCNKLWNAARFGLGILGGSGKGTEWQSDKVKEGPIPHSATPHSATPHSATPPLRHSATSLVDRWMLSRLTASVADVNAALGEYQFASYAQTLYDILWRDFCDWYLEAIKPTAASDAAQRAVLAHALDAIVRLLHPVAPFVTEAIWEHLREVETAPIEGITLGPSRVDGLLCCAGWPVFAGSLRDEAAERDFERVRALVTAIREVRSQHQVQPKRRVTLHAPASLIGELRASGGLAYVENLAGLEAVVEGMPEKGARAAAVTFEALELALSNLAEAVDAGTERERLAKELADKEKAIMTISKRLENPGYMAKAPAKLVEESKQQLATLDAERAAIRDRLASLG